MQDPNPRPPDKGDELYNVMADKVGFVPNIRAKDNLIQLGCVAGATLLGSGIGFLVNGWVGAIIGGLGGLVGGLLISGAVLGVVGLVRKS